MYIKNKSCENCRSFFIVTNAMNVIGASVKHQNIFLTFLVCLLYSVWCTLHKISGSATSESKNITKKGEIITRNILRWNNMKIMKGCNNGKVKTSYMNSIYEVKCEILVDKAWENRIYSGNSMELKFEEKWNIFSFVRNLSRNLEIWMKIN